MSDEPKKSAYPYIPGKTWWELRRRFNQSWPTAVSADYLQSVLEIGEGHANNLLSDLQDIGLVGEDHRPTELANDWRSEELYSEVCRRILDEHYPPELRDAFSGADLDRVGVLRWFQRNLKIGVKAAEKLASFYALLSRADHTEQDKAPKPTPAKRESATKATDFASPRRVKGASEPARDRRPTGSSETTTIAPSVVLQFQIGPDTSDAHIDAIFAGIAKHLRGVADDSAS